MCCYHPLIGVPEYNPRTNKPYHTKNGKIKYRIFSPNKYDTEALLKSNDYITVPCGKCLGCRLDYSREWANRLMMELQYHDSAYFITLTYNEDYVPKSYYADPETGEALQSLTLCKRDLQLFFKRLRKAYPDDHIRYYACGEYGSSTMRPHYHLIVFGLHITDGYPWRWNQAEGETLTYYRSPTLERVWSESRKEDGKTLVFPMGHVEFSDVTWATCAYTARYVTKKLNGPAAEFYDTFALDPPFSVMSRKPGIARQYYDDHDNLFQGEFINLSTPKGGVKFRPPKYFERIFEVEYPDEAEQRKEVKKAMAKNALAAKLQQTNLPLDEILSAAEDVKSKRVKSLKRSGI